MSKVNTALMARMEQKIPTGTSADVIHHFNYHIYDLSSTKYDSVVECGPVYSCWLAVTWHSLEPRLRKRNNYNDVNEFLHFKISELIYSSFKINTNMYAIIQMTCVSWIRMFLSENIELNTLWLSIWKTTTTITIR